MKIILTILILSLSAAAPSFAQNNMEAMRFLTVNALMQYGQKLYDRGDFNGAYTVFNHVLAYDSHQAQALEYIKEMRPAAAPMSMPVYHPVIVEKFTVPTLKIADVSDTESLKRAIEAKKKSIEKLRAQIIQLRANLASQSK